VFSPDSGLDVARGQLTAAQFPNGHGSPQIDGHAILWNWNRDG
jgi:hypothetical protein